MKKGIMRFLSMILTLIVGLSMMSFEVFAVEDAGEAINTEATEAQEETSEVNVAATNIRVVATDSKAEQGGKVSVKWDRPAGAGTDTEYTVSWGEGTKVTGTTETILSGLTNGQEYTVKVECKVGNPDVEYSGSATATPTMPVKVTKLGYLHDYNGVTLKWDVPADNNIVGYKFYRNGKLLYTKKTTELNRNRKDNTKYEFYIGGSGYNDKSGKNENYRNNYAVEPIVKDEAINAYTPAAVSTSGDCVRPYFVKITFKSSASLKCHDGDGYKRTFKKGTTVYATGFSAGKYIFYYKINGKYYKFYANRTRTKNASCVYTSSWDYTTEEAENFVNHKGLSSSTSYLVWTSFYTQQVYVFKGSKGKWVCKKTHKISTGKATSPSPNGNKKIWKHISYRHNLKYWSCFSTYNAFHSVTASSWKKKLGKPASGGCIRNLKDNAYWIYKNCKNGTAVYNY